MADDVRPLEALIAEKIAEWREVGLRMCPKVQQPNGGWSRQEYVDRPVGALYLMHADELAALLQAAAPPAPTAEPKWIASGMTSYTADGEVTGYINPTAAPPERVSEGKAP